MHKAIALFVLVCSFVAAQGLTNNKGQTVNLTSVPEQATTRLSFYTSGSEVYRCEALTVQPSFSWTKAATTLTNIAVSSNVGTVTIAADHGLTAGNKVTITGAAAGQSALNGTYAIATVGASTTFTIATSGVGDGTYTTATLAVTTTAPRTTVGIWAVRRWVYSGTDNTQAQWATTSVSTSTGGVRMTSVCGDRATLSYN